MMMVEGRGEGEGCGWLDVVWRLVWPVNTSIVVVMWLLVMVMVEGRGEGEDVADWMWYGDEDVASKDVNRSSSSNCGGSDVAGSNGCG